MCRVTGGETPADEALQRLQQELEQLQLQQTGGFDLRNLPVGCKGSGPRLFCGHVPKEATEDLVRAHFSRWGTVTDVYFPRHKKTLKRRPFCFVTFASNEAAERALAESPLNICGIPIKNLTMVEDRDAYYRTKHANTRAALIQALQSIGNSTTGPLGPDQLNNLAALLAMEGVTPDAIVALLPQGNGLAQMGNNNAQLEALLGAPAGRSFPQSSMLAPQGPSPSLYDAYGPQLGAMPQQRMAPPTFAQNGRSPSPYGSSGFATNPSPLPLEAQLQQLQAQQSLLAQRLQLQQQFAGMGGMQFPPPQYTPAPQAPSPFFPPQPQSATSAPLQPSGSWGLAGQQPLRAPTPPSMLPPGMAPLASAPGSHSSGSGSPQLEAGAQRHISLDEALAALSKLKAAQQGAMPEAPRMMAPPSAEILAGLGSFSTNSPALSNSPNLGTSPPSSGSGLLNGCGGRLEVSQPQPSLWASEGMARHGL